MVGLELFYNENIFNARFGSITLSICPRESSNIMTFDMVVICKFNDLKNSNIVIFCTVKSLKSFAETYCSVCKTY